jgi:hypothetical protein
MVKITDLKPGDVVKVIDEGVERDGIVEEISREENMACINNGVQEFWYPPEEIVPVPLTEQQLLMLGFERQVNDDGVKYLRGPFRVLVHDPGNYTNLEIWYREDRRHFDHPLYVHELQNHYLQMTKVPLEKPLTQ